jgi:redox-sensitive bicupin YhaK (pirin superfamily)
MTATLHKANTRGHASHGWLDSYHTFSFANYYNPERVHFGALRVLNDDMVAADMGFGKHPHDNMEIISIPLSGDLAHEDSMGHKQVIRQGDVQVMSAGTGVFHSEYNPNIDKAAKFLQIWLFPNQKNVTPRYGQQTFDVKDRHNRWQNIINPDPNSGVLWLHQDAWFDMGDFEAGQESTYTLRNPANGLYIFVLEGNLEANGQALECRDGLGITGSTEVRFTFTSDAQVLLMEVPMELS